MLFSLTVASHNRGKADEIESLTKSAFDDQWISINSLADYHGQISNVVEDRGTFAGNAKKKAVFYNLLLGVPVIADDSGLCVDALDGMPGVKTARYAEAMHEHELDNIDLLLREMEGVEDRSATFKTVLAYADGSEQHYMNPVVFEGTLEGQISRNKRGDNGFAYDVVFEPEGEGGKTLAEISADRKQAISHRSKAVRQFLDFAINASSG